MQREELLDQARHDALAYRAWGADGRWGNLLQASANESDDFAPASVVLWEVLWRLHPELTPASWKEHGYPSDNQRLNPFMNEPLSLVHVDAVFVLEKLDPEASELYAEVVRAERLPEWPDADALMAAARRQRHTSEEADQERQRRLAATPRRPPRGRRFQWTPDELLKPKGPSDVLDDYERALTRLVLVGHAPTTQLVLPFLMTIEAPSPDVIDEVGMMRFAWDRLVPHERRTVAGSTIRASLHRDGNGGLARASTVALAIALASTIPQIGRFKERNTSHTSPEDEGEHGEGAGAGAGADQ